MFVIAFGKLKIPPTQFYDMTPRELDYCLRGYMKEKEEAYQMSWTQTRWHAWWVVRGYTNKIKTPRELTSFPWEEDNSETTRPTLTKEQFLEWFE